MNPVFVFSLSRIDVAESDKEAGIQAFAELLELESEKTKWGFKSLKRMCKLSYELKVC